MEEATIYTYTAKKDGLLKTTFYENGRTFFSRGEEINLKEEYFKKSRIGYNFKENLFEISNKGKKYTTSRLIRMNSGRNAVHLFTDEKTKGLFFIKDGEVSGPYEGVLYMDEDSTAVVIENGKVIRLDSTFYKHRLNCTCVSENVVKNDAGKYAYMHKGEIITGFCFDSPDIVLLGKTWGNGYFFDKNKKILYSTSNEKIVQTVENFEGEEINKDQSYDNLFIVSSPEETCVFNKNTGEVLLNLKGKFKVLGDNKTVAFSGEKKTYVIKSNYPSKENGYKTTFTCTEIPYETTAIKNDCVQIKGNGGKCACATVADGKCEILTDFIFDEDASINKDNRTDLFMPIIADKNVGLFNTQTKKVEIAPFCDEIDLSYSGHAKAGENFYRFIFRQDNKSGVVNSHGNIEIEPVLYYRNVEYPEFKKFSYNSNDVYVGLSKPHIFARPGDIKHYSVEETRREVKTTSPKYSDEQVAAGTIAAGLLFESPIAAMYAYNQMKDQTETTTKTVIDKKETEYDVDVNLPDGLAKFVHLENDDMDKSALLSVEKYLERNQKQPGNE